jgi:hypothetical protein
VFYKKNGYIIANAREQVYILKVKPNQKSFSVNKLSNLDFVLQNSTFTVENLLMSPKEEIIVICLKDLKST